MKNLWRDDTVAVFQDDPLATRVYSSRLLGQEPQLVLHGGGNTSVKVKTTDFFGNPIDLLYVKGSGWDLATIEKAGFSPVKMDVLLALAAFESLSDTVIVREQRAGLTDPFAPNPSVEAILHAIIPFQYVGHTHADAVIAVMNTPNGRDNIEAIYGNRVLIVPYVMPGFKLARKVYDMIQGLDWSSIEGIILMNHGVFTFADDARTSYNRMIDLVTLAEDFLRSKNAYSPPTATAAPTDFIGIAALRKAVSEAAGKPMLARLDDSPSAVGYVNRDDLKDIAFQGPLTPDHIIRTKRIPVNVTQDYAADIAQYVSDYRDYFQAYASDNLTMLDPAPRWGVWHEQGIVNFGENPKALEIITDIVAHTYKTQSWSAAVGGWQALPPNDLFDMEYWELEQAKLAKGGTPPPLAGKIALVTGAASGIGWACAEVLLEQGAAVAALDLSENVIELFQGRGKVGIQGDVSNPDVIALALEQTVRQFGGLDIVVSNAGYFPPNARLEAMNAAVWDKSVAINLTSHQRVLQAAIPYLKQGIDPAVVMVGSKNVPAPGPGAASYSVMKAGITQLARVAALELAKDGIRVNVVHPDAVFDTGLWTPELLETRAAHYGISVNAYKTKNLLQTEITSRDVGLLVAAMVGKPFSKTTGAQVPIDGGNDRVI